MMGSSINNLEELEILKEIAKEQKKYTIEELKLQTHINKDERVINLLLSLFTKELQDSNTQLLLEKEAYLKRLLYYINLYIYDKRTIQIDYVINSFSQIKDMIYQVPNCDSKGKIYTQWHYLKNHLLDKCRAKNVLEGIRFYLFDLVFQQKNIKDIKLLLNNFPYLVNAKNEERTHLFDLVYNKYIELLLNYDNSYNTYNEILYYDNVIDLLIEREDFYIDQRSEMNIINNLSLFVDSIGSMQPDIDQKSFLLTRLIKKVTNRTSYDILELDRINYKYGINNVDGCNNLEESIKEEISSSTSNNDDYIMTIDLDGSLCLEDALSIKKLENEHYLLGIHISDVASLIDIDSPYDLEARMKRRGMNPRFTMFPYNLIMDNCSLNYRYKRPVVSCLIDIDPQGNICQYQFLKQSVTVNTNLYHSNADNILKELKNTPEGANLSNCKETIKNLHTLWKLLESKTNENGNNNNSRESTSKRMVATFMRLYSSLVSEEAVKNNIPLLYGVIFDNNKGKLIKYLQNYGEQRNHSSFEKSMLNIIEGLNDIEIKYATSAEHLVPLIPENRSLALSDVQNYRFGKNFFLHATSPGRRYEDFNNQHVIINCIIEHKNESREKWEARLQQIADLYNCPFNRYEAYLDECDKVKGISAEPLLVKMKEYKH